MGYNSETGNKEVGNEDMDWKQTPDISKKKRNAAPYKRLGLY